MPDNDTSTGDADSNRSLWLAIRRFFDTDGEREHDHGRNTRHSTDRPQCVPDVANDFGEHQCAGPPAPCNERSPSMSDPEKYRMATAAMMKMITPTIRRVGERRDMSQEARRCALNGC